MAQKNSLQDEITYTCLGNGIYNFSSPPVGFQQYLVLGKEKALLIDTGIGIGSLKNAIKKITELPIMVINTHGHPDHVGGNAEFDLTLICPADLDVFKQMAGKAFREQDIFRMPNGSRFLSQLQPDPPTPDGVSDEEKIDLGGRMLKIIYTPGHTHGSICIFDEETGTLFSGDNIQAKETALKEWNSSPIETFVNSLHRLESLPITKIMGGHKPNINEPELLGKVLRCAQAILDGAKGSKIPTRDGATCICYESPEGVSITYTEHNV